MDGDRPRYTLLNNWEATGFNFTQDTLVKLFDDAAKLGVDLFLLDDGWFGNKYPRTDARGWPGRLAGEQAKAAGRYWLPRQRSGK
jgi:alpha-galactosidase